MSCRAAVCYSYHSKVILSLASQLLLTIMGAHNLNHWCLPSQIIPDAKYINHQLQSNLGLQQYQAVVQYALSALSLHYTQIGNRKVEQPMLNGEILMISKKNKIEKWTAD